MHMERIPREVNAETDYLARMASGDPEEGLFCLEPILELSQPSYKEEEQMRSTATVSNIEHEEDS